MQGGRESAYTCPSVVAVAVAVAIAATALTKRAGDGVARQHDALRISQPRHELDGEGHHLRTDRLRVSPGQSTIV